MISLAAAAALPADVPQRSLLVFLTFTTVLGTLLVQGLTLPRLIRRLGVGRAGGGSGPTRPPRWPRSRPVQGRAPAAGRPGRQDLPRPPEVVERLRRLAGYPQAGARERLRRASRAGR